ncbi:MAG: hypothetical protein IGS39_18120 [Calothrix sp. C42_A2020_038]|nr:hypothetical protein [Calothrix sp. C42_A2020_038]
MSVPIAFLICTEPGRLEKQSLLLAESIRQFGGNLKDTPIYSFHPRQGEPISSKTIKELESLAVHHQQIILNTDYFSYPYANKPLVCDYAEQNIDADILVFLDSDQCFFNEPKELLLPSNFNIGLRPEYGKSIGSTGSGDTFEDYWLKLYDVFDVKEEIFVKPAIGNTKIRGYWNSGMVSARRSAGIFTAWKDNFMKLMKLNITPPQASYFIDQIVLSITICSRAEKVFHFSSPYSYPFPLHNRLSEKYKLNSFDEIVSIHYFNMFYYNNWNISLNKIKILKNKSEKYKWLCDNIARHNMPHLKMSQYYLFQIKSIENKLKKLNINLNFSNYLERVLN